MVNQQGTLLKDTSETICIESFNWKINKAFVNWFIGFIEGHENVFIVNRRYLRFEINCSLKNQSIIYLIQNKLGFGNIRRLKFLDTIIIEFSVQENIYDLLKLVDIFNGNLRCTSKEQYFRIWYNKLKVKLKKMNLSNLLPEYIEKIKDINLKNSWFLGYIDSRALFYGRWHKSKKIQQGKEIYSCCIFWHLNKDLLYKIKKILNIKKDVEYKFKWNLPFYKLTIDEFEEKKKIYNYLLQYKLKSIKIKRYKYWVKLLNLENLYIETKKLDFNKVEEILVKLSSTINEDELSKI
jgi:hypothetical protein